MSHTEYMSIDDMVAVVQLMYPGIVPGKEFVLIVRYEDPRPIPTQRVFDTAPLTLGGKPGVGYDADYEDGVQEVSDVLAGHAEIYQWNSARPQPSQAELVAYWTEHRDEVLRFRTADAIRAERNRRLVDADRLVEKALDAEDDDAERAARRYRKALRDLPDLPGFPFDFEWPVAPD